MAEPRMSGEKRCSRCGEEKPVLAFGVDRRASDGLLSACRSCLAEARAVSPRAKAGAGRRAERLEREARMAYSPRLPGED